MPPSASSTRSASSSSSSTFSDVSVSYSVDSAASSPPASSKTHAFFSSSFAASPPPPRPLSLKKVASSSSTESTSSTEPSRQPPAPSIPAVPHKTSRFNVSRIFPSRYTRSRRDSNELLDIHDAFSSNALRRKPEFLFIDVDDTEVEHIEHPREHAFSDMFLPLPTAVGFHHRTGSDPSTSPPSSISSSSSHVEIRLPTPPPPAPPLLTASSTSSSDSDFTPRPPNLEPSLSEVHRSIPTLAKEPVPPDPELHEGDVIAEAGGSLASPSLRLIHPLGNGAFSQVWLAEDLSLVPLTLASERSVRDLKRQTSLQWKGNLSRKSSQKSVCSRGVSRNSSLRKFKSRVKGTQPSLDCAALNGRVAGQSETERESDSLGFLLPSSPPTSNPVSPRPPVTPLPAPEVGLGASLSRQNSGNGHSSESRVVAVKFTPRRPEPYSSQAEERTRVGFIREVEVLRHISHPNITPLLSFFSTPTHHVLVLPYLKGGDLLSLVNKDSTWNVLTESLLRRMWIELCRAVGWMHSVGLVHRDIKLENILLTEEGLALFSQSAADAANAPPSSTPRVDLSNLPTPLIKLTDFGLSRFIDIGNGERGQGEMLSTRCGSEAYAAPELVMGGGPRGGYDARETDAWACGVVLYALVGRKLPFGEGVGMDGGSGITSHIGGERVHPLGYRSRRHAVERRAWLMKIARGEYEWPEAPKDGVKDGQELAGPWLASSEDIKRVAGRLLVRDPKKRARIQELWDDPWMRTDPFGEGIWESLQEPDAGTAADAAPRGLMLNTGDKPMNLVAGDGGENLDEGEWEPLSDQSALDGDEDLEEEIDGWLLDEDSIASIARQEVV